MENNKHKFDWNTIDWKNYPCGIYFFNKPVKGISLGKVENLSSSKVIVSYWDKGKWRKIKN